MKLKLDCQHNNIDNKKECSGCAWARESIPYLKNSYSESRAEYAAALFFGSLVGVAAATLCVFEHICVHRVALFISTIHREGRKRCKNNSSLSFSGLCLLSTRNSFFSFFLLFLLSTSHFHHPPLGDRRANQAPSHQTIIKLTEGSFGDISSVEAENCVGFRRFDGPHWDGDRVFRPKSITLMNFKSFSAQMLTTSNNNCWSFFIFYLLVSIYISFSPSSCSHQFFIIAQLAGGDFVRTPIVH